MFLEIEFLYQTCDDLFFSEILKHKWTDSIAKRKRNTKPTRGATPASRQSSQPIKVTFTGHVGRPLNFMAISSTNSMMCAPSLIEFLNEGLLSSG